MSATDTRSDTHLDSLLDTMTLEEQASLLAGADFWHTVAIPRLGVPSVKLSAIQGSNRLITFGFTAACFHR